MQYIIFLSSWSVLKETFNRSSVNLSSLWSHRSSQLCRKLCELPSRTETKTSSTFYISAFSHYRNLKTCNLTCRHRDGFCFCFHWNVSGTKFGRCSRGGTKSKCQDCLHSVWEFATRLITFPTNLLLFSNYFNISSCCIAVRFALKLKTKFRNKVPMKTG